MYLPGTPRLYAGQEVGRDPEDQPPPGVRPEPMNWAGGGQGVSNQGPMKPYQSGKTC